jgi:hypothetical protein
MQSKTKGFEEILERFPSRDRIRFFLLFVLLSLSFWVSTKLSNSYQVDQDFHLVWSKPPKGIILTDNHPTINLSITASGIEIVWYRMFKNTIELALESTDFNSESGIVSIEKQRFSIRQQLFDNTELNAINTDTLRVQFSKLATKKVKVFPNVSIKMRPGYLSDGQLTSVPDSVLVHGSSAVLDTLVQIQTFPFSLNDGHTDFKTKLKLKPIEALQFDVDTIQIAQSISKYSEKEFIVPIKIINLPSNLRIKLFPPSTTIKAILPLAIFSGVKASDFSLVVDYGLISTKKTTQLPIRLVKQPSQVKKVIWEPKSVNYLIRK